ncbi:MAG: 5-(carboxyamino)imidazole ribonucleotide mutase [Acidobacteria bacterium]|nr:5-(carboxyamino)imidazole ribonucleotide mutase [Acidobacteriota bacterium]
MSDKPLVSIVMGSDSDLPIMTETARMLEKLQVPYEMEISSAHRSPARTAAYARKAAGRGIKAIVAGAGGAFHLAGVIAAETTLPVIAVPIANSSLGGMDALLAAVQMPGGVPVGVMAIGKAGAVNAGIFCAQIIATADAALSGRLAKYKEELAQAVEEKSTRLKAELLANANDIME